MSTAMSTLDQLIEQYRIVAIETKTDIAGILARSLSSSGNRVHIISTAEGENLFNSLLTGLSPIGQDDIVIFYDLHPIMLKIFYRIYRHISRLILILPYVDSAEYPEAVIYSLPVSVATSIRYHTRNYNLNDPQIIDDTADIIQNFNYSSVDGHILVYTPFVDELKQRLISLGESERNIITGESVTFDGNRKIILTSGDYSINANIVIDLMMSYNETVSSGGGYRYGLQYISKESAQTHAMGSTICYRMCTKKFYDNLTLKTDSPTIRLNILLALVRAGLGSYILDSDELEIMNGLIDVEDIDVLVGLPLGLKNNQALLRASRAGLPMTPVVYIMSFIDSYDPARPYFWTPLRQDETVGEYELVTNEYAKLFTRYKGADDLETFYNLSVIISRLRRDELMLWTRKHNFNTNKILEVDQVSKSILMEPSNIDNVDKETVLAGLRAIIADVYADNIMQRKEAVGYYSDNAGLVYSLDNANTSFMLSDPPERIVSLYSREIIGSNWIKLAVAIGDERTKSIEMAVKSALDETGLLNDLKRLNNLLLAP